MASKKDNAIQPMLLDLERRCAGYPNLQALARRVVNEFNKIHQIDSKVKDPDRRRINKILHAMRGLETGLETFLSIYGIAPTIRKEKNMGNYMKKLQRPPSRGLTFAKIPSNVFNAGFAEPNGIRFKRNRYLHQADMYPTEPETEKIIEEVYKFYQQVLNLG